MGNEGTLGKPTARRYSPAPRTVEVGRRGDHAPVQRRAAAAGYDPTRLGGPPPPAPPSAATLQAVHRRAWSRRKPVSTGRLGATPAPPVATSRPRRWQGPRGALQLGGPQAGLAVLAALSANLW
jgi:hypothetical protein